MSPTTASAPLPDPESITFRDVVQNRWSIAASCEACRCLRAPALRQLRADQLVLRIGRQWRAGKLVCQVHRTPFDGLEISAGGNLTTGFTVVGRWYQPGRWPDPEYEARMRPIREANSRRLKEQP